MSALDIHPHSRQGSNLAVALLVLLAAGAFVAGMNNQLIGASGLSPFPAAGAVAAAGSRVPDAIPEATPAPDMQLADAAPPVVHRAPRPAADPEDAAPAPTDGAPAADTPPAVDAAATAPDAPPPAQSQPATDSAEPPA